jgi:hypothetical protein
MPTTRERLAARLNTIVAALGITDVRIEPDDVRRVHAGRHQRSEGAFSWFAQPRSITGRLVSLGSQFTAAECVRLPVIVSPSFDGWVLDPVFREHRAHNGVPQGAAFGTIDDLTLSGVGAVRWYDAAGVAL